MTSAALIELLRLVETAGIAVWLDGGWGVDALLRTQTREHKDVDIVLSVADVPKLQEVLATAGFSVRDGVPPSSFVLADGDGLEVDVHAVSFDDRGNGVYRMRNGEDWIYPAEGFSGRGLIGGATVQCLSPSVQVLSHAYGYEPVEKDLRDMELLARQFNLDLPPQLRRRPPEEPSDHGHSEEWEQVWEARKRALEAVLGPTTDRVFHAVIPLDLGGSADVLEFPDHVPGATYVTADLVGPSSGQPESTLGQYELMICTRVRESWAPGLISRLARYTLEAVLEPGETMDIGPALPEGSSITGLLFAEPDLLHEECTILDQRWGILLCVGITAPELQACLAGKTSEVLRALKAGGVFPYTDLRR